MDYEWDENKNRLNRLKHGIDLIRIEEFDWKTAQIIPDDRRDYAELRYKALGFIGGRLYACVYAWRGGLRRIIGLRKANDRERRKYNEKN